MGEGASDDVGSDDGEVCSWADGADVCEAMSYADDYVWVYGAVCI